MPYALLSVTDKSGLVPFAQGLRELGYDLLSTGGTARTLREAGLPVTEVADLTGFPEMLDGRVKTLHPKVHGGLLADVRREDHRAQLKEAGIEPIPVVAINLYRFEETVRDEHTFEEAVESIDIGGPAMIRASAKNHANVTLVVDPADYEKVLVGLREGNVDRKALAAKAFRHTAFYDSVIARYLGEGDLTETLTVGYRKRQVFRYGENMHQPAAWYVDPLESGGVANAVQLWGKEMSYNNLADADAAWELVCDLPAGACAIIKHANPCGAAAGSGFGGKLPLGAGSRSDFGFWRDRRVSRPRERGDRRSDDGEGQLP